VDRRRWGWHRLDPQWAATLVADAGVGNGDLVLDVGAGHGVLTAALVAVGARVIAVEAHPGRAAHLRARFGNDIVLVQADAADLRLPRRSFRVVANPPFAITSALLQRLVHASSRLERADLILQRQAAKQWADIDRRRAVRARRSFDVALGRPIPRSAFTPRPTVDAQVLVVRRREPAVSARTTR
jgi:23S rRNA (adenine-N6)-dimethyltransferase